MWDDDFEQLEDEDGRDEFSGNRCPEGGEHEADEDGVCYGCGRTVR